MPNVVKACPSSGLCYSLSIPESTAQAGTGSIYFQIVAPANNVWAAIAQGSQMAGANMFIIYQNAAGTNLTVSPRAGTGEVMPIEDQTAQFELLEGSGIMNGNMVANIRCDNCTTWSGGTLDYQSSSSSWLYAAAPGSPLMSDDPNADIPQHTPYGTFNFATTMAIGGPDENPFLNETITNTTSTNSTTMAATSGFNSLSVNTQNALVDAHAVLCTFAFVALFPLGAYLMRTRKINANRLMIHGTVQLVAYLIFIVGAGIGIYIAVGSQQLVLGHPLIGIGLLAVILMMPVFGYVHHQWYKRLGRRTWMGHLHANLGRFIIILGIANGGFGLKLACADMKAYIAYAAAAGTVGLAYVLMVIYHEFNKGKPQPTTPQKDKVERMDSANGWEQPPATYPQYQPSKITYQPQVRYQSQYQAQPQTQSHGQPQYYQYNYPQRV